MLIISTDTFVDRVLGKAAQAPDLPVLTYLLDAEHTGQTLAYRALSERARAVGQLLLERKLGGARVLLMFPPGLDYVVALTGTMCAGAVGIPTVPFEPSRPGHTLPPLLAIASDARPSAVLTTTALREAALPMLREVTELAGIAWLTVDDIDLSRAAEWWRPDLDGDSLAMCQYTSGSVGTPKGVILSHGNLMHNQEVIRTQFRHEDGSPAVLWLPHTFDMGCHGILHALYCGFPLTLMSPIAFLHRPVRWLQAISRTRSTSSGGPNFAYDLCVRRIPEEQREGLDLSSWRLAFNGAEPVRADTMERFVEAFGPHGFSRRAFLPCYGSAEVTLIATGGPPGTGPIYARLDPVALERGEVVPAEPSSPACTVVSCGAVPDNASVRIIDPVSLVELPDDRVGEIWIHSGSKAVGYLGRPEETAERFFVPVSGDETGRRYLRSGDLGFLRDGQLYVTGRRAELLIVSGRNHYAHDLERTAEQAHPAVVPGGCVAFAVTVGSAERVALLAEVDHRRRNGAGDLSSIVDAIRRLVAEERNIRLQHVHLLRRGSLAKTPSGKIRRNACRAAYLSGELPMLDGGS